MNSNREDRAIDISQNIADDWINGNRSDALARLDGLEEPRLIALVSIKVWDMLGGDTNGPNGDGPAFLRALAR